MCELALWIMACLIWVAINATPLHIFIGVVAGMVVWLSPIIIVGAFAVVVAPLIAKLG